MIEWIRVKDRLPGYEEQVIVARGSYIDVVARTNSLTFGDVWEDSYGCYDEIDVFTHWMPLPEPPKEEVQL